MNKVAVLFKKDIRETKNAYFGKNATKDIFGTILTILLILLVYGAFIYCFYGFAKIYLNTILDDPSNYLNRGIELITLMFGVIIVLNALIAVNNIQKLLVDSSDVQVLLFQPILNKDILIYKLIKVYLSQLFSSILIIIPGVICIGIINSELFTTISYLTLILITLLVPLLSTAIGSVLAIPYIYLMRYLNNKYLIKLILLAIFIAGGFLLYSSFLDVFSSLLQTGSIKYSFDLETLTKINTFVNSFYPVISLTFMLLNQNYIISLLIVLGSSLLCFFISLLIISRLNISIIQYKIEGFGNIYVSKKTKTKKKSSLSSLITKEFLITLRTPSYSFQYFATSLILPLLIFSCTTLLCKMALNINILSYVNTNFALSLFCSSLFASLINSYCTSNISRDGRVFYIIKTLPIKTKDYLLSKVLFCLIVSEISLVISSLILFIGNILTVFELILLIFTSSVISIGQICLGTYLDFRFPSFPNNELDEVTESSSAVSKAAFISLIISLFIGFGSIAIQALLSYFVNENLANLLSTIYCVVIAILFAVINVTKLLRNGKKLFTMSSGDM